MAALATTAGAAVVSINDFGCMVERNEAGSRWKSNIPQLTDLKMPRLIDVTETFLSYALFTYRGREQTICVFCLQMTKCRYVRRCANS